MKSLGLIFFVYLTVINLTNSTPTFRYSIFDKLKVEVYYETMCPDSVRFIRNQLYPTIKANNWLPFIDLEFIPYGKVYVYQDIITNSTALICEHGLTECDLNALHACIVEHNSVAEQLELFNCLFRKSQPSIYRCACWLKIDVKAAMNCKDTRTNADILKKYGERTRAIKITSVPSVALGGYFGPRDQEAILTSFTEEICREYTDNFTISLDNC